MMNYLLQNCEVISDGAQKPSDVRIRNGRIDTIARQLSAQDGEKIIDANGQLLLPGLIDDQVHFRQPGLTHKADIASESRAAAAGGVTSYMDMPNVIPPTLAMPQIEEKRAIAAQDSRINYAFYLGASNDNDADIAAADAKRIAGIKIFMGASTGDMLVDDEKILRRIFSCAPTLIATHCESSPRIKKNLDAARQRYGKDIPAAAHPHIRDVAACYESSSLAIDIARQTGARLHVLHISTARELSLFKTGRADSKQITAEACLHHLLLDDSDYQHLGLLMKTNPAVKTAADRAAIRQALATSRIDVIATDHAPHLLEEKQPPYEKAAAGMPLIEYSLPALLELVADNALSYTQAVACAAHNVADIFAVIDRGYIREGYYADLTIVEKCPNGAPARATTLSKCNWTPFADKIFRHRVFATFVNGQLVWDGENIDDSIRGLAVEFNR